MPARTAPLAAAQAPGSPSGVPVTIVAHDIGSVGGMERVLAELIVGLVELGHAVTVIARTCVLPPGTRVAFHRVRGPRRPLLLAYPWFMLAGSLVVRRWRRGLVQETGAIVLNRADIIAVHYCHQAGPANPSRSSPLYRVHSRLVGWLTRFAERACFRANTDATFIGVSEGVADEVREHYPALAEKVMSIHNGVDTESFTPGVRSDDARALRTKLGIADGRLLAAFVGSEWERKGLEPALRALAIAREWDLLVAGDGDRPRYRQLADSLGVAGAVHLLGVTSDVQLIYAAADAFVLPSAYETFSLVTFEAAASGLPLLATPVSGVRELIDEGQNGFLISRDPDEIAARLRQLAADVQLRRRMGADARAAALRFSWSEMVARHHQLYMSLAARPRA